MFKYIPKYAISINVTFPMMTKTVVLGITVLPFIVNDLRFETQMLRVATE